jgi:hypothetical protein
MDWYTIEFLYPDSFKKFIKIMFPNVGLLTISTLDYFDIKKLYKFFDGEGIYLTVEMYNPNQWVFIVSLGNGIVFGPMMESKQTREESECDGFYECFKILDKKIREKI